MHETDFWIVRVRKTRRCPAGKYRGVLTHSSKPQRVVHRMHYCESREGGIEAARYLVENSPLCKFADLEPLRVA